MKNRSLTISIALILVVCVGTTTAQESEKPLYWTMGLSHGAALGNSQLQNAVGFQLGAYGHTTRSYGVGVAFEFMSQLAPSEPVDIPGNLLSNETLETSLHMFGLSMVNHVDLNPESKVKLFLEGNVGFRIANYSVTHYGYLLVFRTNEKVYKRTSGGLLLDLSAGIYIPLNSDSRTGLRLRGGPQFGSPIKYVDDSSIEYTNGKFHYTGEKTSPATYWVTSVELIWRLR